MRYMVVLSGYKQEFACEEDLLRVFCQHADVFLPRYKVRIKPRRLKKTVEVERPMYGRYLFLGLDDIRDENWIDVYTSRFVSSVLLHNMKPIWIPGRMIEEQKKISEECAFKLEQSLVDPVFRPGDKVSIIAGPFAGLKGTVKTKRIVEIELFRGKVDLSLPFHILERR